MDFGRVNLTLAHIRSFVLWCFIWFDSDLIGIVHISPHRPITTHGPLKPSFQVFVMLSQPVQYLPSLQLCQSISVIICRYAVDMSRKPEACNELTCFRYLQGSHVLSSERIMWSDRLPFLIVHTFLFVYYLLATQTSPVRPTGLFITYYTSGKYYFVCCTLAYFTIFYTMLRWVAAFFGFEPIKNPGPQDSMSSQTNYESNTERMEWPEGPQVRKHVRYSEPTGWAHFDWS